MRKIFDKIFGNRAEVENVTRTPNIASDAFTAIEEEKEIRQGELLKNVQYYHTEAKESDDHGIELSQTSFSYAIVATPDCDILQDFKDRKRGKDGKLFSILFFGAETVDNAKGRLGIAGKELKPILKNRMDQFYHFDTRGLSITLSSVAIPSLIVDFKRYFSLRPSEIYRQFATNIDENKCVRLGRLSDLWREDFQRRAMSYMQRVALPIDDDGE